MRDSYRLRSNEECIVGGWEVVDGVTVEDYNTRRVFYVTSNLLHVIGEDPSAWRTLYQDKSDGRYWQLSYDNSDTHGGGTPLLRCISRLEAMKKHGIEL